MLSLMNVYVWILYCRYMYPCKWRACSTTVAAINNYVHLHLSKPHRLQERSACCFTDVWGALIAQALTYTIQLDALSKYGTSWCLITDAAFTQPKSWKTLPKHARYISNRTQWYDNTSQWNMIFRWYDVNSLHVVYLEIFRFNVLCCAGILQIWTRFQRSSHTFTKWKLHLTCNLKSRTLITHIPAVMRKSHQTDNVLLYDPMLITKLITIKVHVNYTCNSTFAPEWQLGLQLHLNYLSKFLTVSYGSQMCSLLWQCFASRITIRAPKYKDSLFRYMNLYHEDKRP